MADVDCKVDPEIRVEAFVSRDATRSVEHEDDLPQSFLRSDSLVLAANSERYVCQASACECHTG